MICLHGETNLSSFAVILYSCICVPFLQIWESFIRLCKFLVDPHHQPESSDNPDWELDLPVSQFEELELNIDEEMMCSICLVELEGGDSVNKLPKCSHLFHAECLDKWIDRCRFTCPLCRSSLLILRVPSSPCKCKSRLCIDLSHDDSS